MNVLRRTEPSAWLIAPAGRPTKRDYVPASATDLRPAQLTPARAEMLPAAPLRGRP